MYLGDKAGFACLCLTVKLLKCAGMAEGDRQPLSSVLKRIKVFLITERFLEANSDPANRRSVQITTAYQTDRAILERHYADALDPSRTHATANVIGLVLAVVSGLLLLTTAG